MNAHLVHSIAALAISISVVAGYHFRVAPRAEAVAVVDVMSVFSERQAELVAKVMKAPNDAERAAVVQQETKRFTDSLGPAMAALAAECSCLVVDKSVLVGAPPGTPDLTAALKGKLK